MKKNEFFDLGQFPAEEGLLIFPISMSRISNSQNGALYFKFLNELVPKVRRRVIGVTFLYTDNLYLKYNPLPKTFQNKYLELMINHKNQFLKNVKTKSNFVENAFNFLTWTQVILETTNFPFLFYKTKEFYKKDNLFQKYVKEDIKQSGRSVSNNYVNFLLEEALLAYLLLKGEIKIPNYFVNGRDKWRLICYPGKPAKSFIYFFQKDIFKIKSDNIFKQGQYDLEQKKFYDFNNIDLESLK